MMKMIIADDEPVITTGIQRLVDWKTLGFEIVGQYADGKAAMEGIIAHKPDIALLDISMPGMTGVEILKECRLLDLTVQVILISGFQDFEYAKAGIRYGAVDYLLKPVIRDELLHAIGKSIGQIEQEQSGALKDEEARQEDYSGLLPLEDGFYLPSYVELFLEEENPQKEKLIRFSVLSFIEEYMEQKNLGIAFSKNDSLVAVFKGMDQGEGKEAATELRERIKERFGYSAGIIVGRPVEHMSEIPGGFQSCFHMKEYFFFADQMHLPVLAEGEQVFYSPGENEQMMKVRAQMIDMVIGQDETGIRKYFGQFVRVVCGMAEGKKEDALFYFCQAVRMLDEKFQALALSRPEYGTKKLLQRGRECGSYRELQTVFYGIIMEYFDRLKDSIVSSSSKDFLRAKIYIDKHYDENLTLEVLAKEIHMNSYYFSSFFKKNAGENFKDYLSRIRIQHAVSLLVSTDMKAYEIALKVGFRDARGFSESFQRIYHETPAAYRKRAKRGDVS